MNISNSYVNVLKFVSASGKKSVLETMHKGAEVNDVICVMNKLDSFKYVPIQYKTVPIGMPQKSKSGITYDKWEELALRNGKAKSDTLNIWFDIIAPKKLNLKRAEQEIKNCYKKENFDRIEFFKTLSPQEKEYITRLSAKMDNGKETRIVDSDEMQFFATLAGYKPAWYCSHGFNRRVDFSKIKLNPKIADKFDVVKLPVRGLYFLNKQEVLKIIEKNKDVYCAEQNLSQTTDTETIYKTLLSNLERWTFNHSSKGEALFGMTLGYPRNSCLIFELENCLGDGILGLRKNIHLLKEKLLNLLYSDKSPYKGYPQKAIKGLEKHIKEMKTVGAGTENLYQCTTYGNEGKAVERLLAIEKDFNENFKIEDLM